MANTAILSDGTKQSQTQSSYFSFIHTIIWGRMAARPVCGCGEKILLIRQMVRARNFAALDEIFDQLPAKTDGA
jgi:hypothetical protein